MQILLEKEVDVIGIVGDGRAMVRAAQRLRPDLIVVDITMPMLNGLDAAATVRRANRSVVVQAFRRGASGYLLKTCATDELIAAVREVMRGGLYISGSLPKDELWFMQQHREIKFDEKMRLTQRQREVLQLLTEGKRMSEVGRKLKMSTRTVAFHKYRMMEALGASSNADLVRYATRNHIIAA
jgi:DNA-binding NarL/FixJ family response regulator